MKCMNYGKLRADFFETIGITMRIYLKRVKESVELQFEAAAQTISRPCCKHFLFDKDYRQLYTKGATLFGLVGK